MWPTLFKHAQATISLTRYQRYATYPWPASDILEGGDARASITESMVSFSAMRWRWIVSRTRWRRGGNDEGPSLEGRVGAARGLEQKKGEEMGGMFFR